MHRFLANLLPYPPFGLLLEQATRGRATILALHRFTEEPGPTTRHTREGLSGFLAWLRRHGFALTPLEEVVTGLRAGRPPARRTVVFTVDDGYADFASIAAPVFLAYSCPVTVFLPTGFLDGKCWMWWDQIDYALSRSPHSRIVPDGSGLPEGLAWNNEAERRVAVRCVVRHLKAQPDATRRRLVTWLAGALDVALPSQPPPECAPLSWTQVRELAARGVQFGAHSVTHPILSSLDAEECREEIAGSGRRIREETSGWVPLFSYPNGLGGDFAERELQIARDAGYDAAFTMMPGHVGLDDLRPALGAMALPRIPYGEAPGYLQQVVVGLERVKTALGRGWHPREP
jgi:peptidoglycan/xylan/chitin deacetylase (PgdA/CDA1 family)